MTDSVMSVSLRDQLAVWEAYRRVHDGGGVHELSLYNIEMYSHREMSERRNSFKREHACMLDNISPQPLNNSRCLHQCADVSNHARTRRRDAGVGALGVDMSGNHANNDQESGERDAPRAETAVTNPPQRGISAGCTTLLELRRNTPSAISVRTLPTRTTPQRCSDCRQGTVGDTLAL